MADLLTAGRRQAAALLRARAARNAALCYIHEPWTRGETDRTAYFTTQPLTHQWGDDWDDAPYDCNAGRPYTWRSERYAQQPDGKYRMEPNPDPQGRIYAIEFTGPFDTLAGIAFNTPYSVEDINGGRIPWLWTDNGDDPPVVINAGVTVGEFRRRVKQAGGTLDKTEEYP